MSGKRADSSRRFQSLEDINVKTVTDVTSDILVSPSAFVVEQIGDNYHEEPILGFSIVNETGAYFIPKDIAVESEVFKEWVENDEQTSAFSMLEILVAVLSKGDVNKRKRFAWLGGIAIFIVGVPSALSYGVLSDVTIFHLSIFDAADYLVSNILMPLGALLISIFVPLKIPYYDVLKTFIAVVEEKKLHKSGGKADDLPAQRQSAYQKSRERISNGSSEQVAQTLYDNADRRHFISKSKANGVSLRTSQG